MSESELLAVIVEFSVGLGGFSAIAAAFIHQNQVMKAVDIYRTLNLLMMALGPGFVALGNAALLSPISLMIASTVLIALLPEESYGTRKFFAVTGLNLPLFIFYIVTLITLLKSFRISPNRAQ